MPEGVEHVLVGGAVGPRGDGYLAGELDADRYADYHRPQLEAFADAGADLATAYTMTTVAEAAGVVRAAQSVGLPVAISYTVETDGRLPDGTTWRPCACGRRRAASASRTAGRSTSRGCSSSATVPRSRQSAPIAPGATRCAPS